VKKIYSWLS